MKIILEKFAKLIDLKSIITLALAITLIYGFASGKIDSKDFLVYVTMVFTFYFAKKDDGKEANNMTTIENQKEEEIITGTLTNEESSKTGGEE